MDRIDKQERTQRIRYGLTGLAVVFLFVLLGAAISRSAEDPHGPPPAAQTTPDSPNDPLAEIGAAPGTTSTNDAADDNEIAAPSK